MDFQARPSRVASAAFQFLSRQGIFFACTVAFAIPVSKLLSIDATRRQRTAGGELKEKQRRKCHPLEMTTADNDDVSEFDALEVISFVESKA